MTSKLTFSKDSLTMQPLSLTPFSVLRQNRATKTKTIPGTPHFEAWTEVSFAPILGKTGFPVRILADSPDAALLAAKASFPRILLAVEPVPHEQA
jgi:hypothetical protein